MLLAKIKELTNFGLCTKQKAQAYVICGETEFKPTCVFKASIKGNASFGSVSGKPRGEDMN